MPPLRGASGSAEHVAERLALGRSRKIEEVHRFGHHFPRRMTPQLRALRLKEFDSADVVVIAAVVQRAGTAQPRSRCQPIRLALRRSRTTRLMPADWRVASPWRPNISAAGPNRLPARTLGSGVASGHAPVRLPRNHHPQLPNGVAQYRVDNGCKSTGYATMVGRCASKLRRFYLGCCVERSGRRKPGGCRTPPIRIGWHSRTGAFI